MNQVAEAIQIQNGEDIESLFYLGTLKMKKKQIDQAAEQFK